MQLLGHPLSLDPLPQASVLTIALVKHQWLGEVGGRKEKGMLCCPVGMGLLSVRCALLMGAPTPDP